jgi:hypothetical protein
MSASLTRRLDAVNIGARLIRSGQVVFFASWFRDHSSGAMRWPCGRPNDSKGCRISPCSFRTYWSRPRFAPCWVRQKIACRDSSLPATSAPLIGVRDYEELVHEFHVPIVVGGFEPIDLLEAIHMLVTQLEEGRAEVENQYSRSVQYEGNQPAQKAVALVFEVSDRKWRGIGARFPRAACS